MTNGHAAAQDMFMQRIDSMFDSPLTPLIFALLRAGIAPVPSLASRGHPLKN